MAIFAWVAPIFANLHSAITQRAFALTVKNVKQKTSIALSRPVAYHTEVQHSIAEAVHESPAMEESTPLCSPEQGR